MGHNLILLTLIGEPRPQVVYCPVTTFNKMCTPLLQGIQTSAQQSYQKQPVSNETRLCTDKSNTVRFDINIQYN